MSERGGRAFLLLTDGALKCVCVCVYVLGTSVCYALLVTRGFACLGPFHRQGEYSRVK